MGENSRLMMAFARSKNMGWQHFFNYHPNGVAKILDMGWQILMLATPFATPYFGQKTWGGKHFGHGVADFFDMGWHGVAEFFDMGWQLFFHI